MTQSAKPTLIVVEGRNDAEFLRHVSTVLHTHDAALPDLRRLEQAGQIVFVPLGGVDLHTWAYGLAGLGCREFFLIDREAGQTSVWRQQLAAMVNARPGCVARVTAKRALENYLHPTAILAARGIEVDFGDDDDVPALVARQVHLLRTPATDWSAVPHRERKRLRNRVKRWLNSEAVMRMTPELLQERDTSGEVAGWLSEIAGMATTG